jgi:toxin ParE1/3/4
MKHSVLFIQSAEDDLFDIYRYIYVNDTPSAADKIHKGIIDKCKSLESYPKRGHIPSELAAVNMKEYLEVHYKVFRIIYQIGKGDVFIHSILDGRREVKTILEERVSR